MIAVITGDIIHSQSLPVKTWLPILKKALNQYGNQPEGWEIYQGDSFQLKIQQPEEALKASMFIKASIKTLKELDVRLSIGLGKVDFESSRISEANGSAFVRSGRGYETLKEQKRTMGIFSGNQEFDHKMSVILPLMLIAMDNWKPGAAELVIQSILYPEKSQKEIGALLGITQSSVSERLNRSYLKELLNAEAYYRVQVNELKES